MKIERFEDIEGWQEARVLARMVYKVSDKGRFAKDFPLRRQIEDAAASVMANIADKKLINGFIRYLRKSQAQTT